MVVTNVHAVSSAAVSAHGSEINGSGSDFFRPKEKDNVRTTIHDDVPQQSGSFEPMNTNQAPGVQKMEAITMVWTKNWLVAAYVLYVPLNALRDICELADPSE